MAMPIKSVRFSEGARHLDVYIAEAASDSPFRNVFGVGLVRAPVFEAYLRPANLEPEFSLHFLNSRGFLSLEGLLTTLACRIESADNLRRAILRDVWADGQYNTFYYRPFRVEGCTIISVVAGERRDMEMLAGCAYLERGFWFKE